MTNKKKVNQKKRKMEENSANQTYTLKREYGQEKKAAAITESD